MASIPAVAEAVVGAAEDLVVAAAGLVDLAAEAGSPAVVEDRAGEIKKNCALPVARVRYPLPVICAGARARYSVTRNFF